MGTAEQLVAVLHGQLHAGFVNAGAVPPELESLALADDEFVLCLPQAAGTPGQSGPPRPGSRPLRHVVARGVPGQQRQRHRHLQPIRHPSADGARRSPVSGFVAGRPRVTAWRYVSAAISSSVKPHSCNTDRVSAPGSPTGLQAAAGVRLKRGAGDG